MLVYLASSSPRRIKILRSIGLKFKVIYPRISEDSASGKDVVLLALDKVRSVFNSINQGIIISADTQVVVNSVSLGKPRDVSDVRNTLRMLSGRSHTVRTGLVVVNRYNGRTATATVESKVYFKKLTDEEIEWYIATGEPFGKAGSYAIQGLGSMFIERIEGDFYNIVGLPVGKLYDLMMDVGVDLKRIISSSKAASR